MAETSKRLNYKTCPNCGQMTGAGKFCPTCGQKNELPKLALRSLFSAFFSILFNLDNQFFNTLRASMTPSLLAKNYVKGRRKRYLHPLRFFFYAWLAYALISSFGSKLLDVSMDNAPFDTTAKSHLSLLIKKDSVDIKNKGNSTLPSATKGFLDEISSEDGKPKKKNKGLYLYSRSHYAIYITADSSQLTPPTDSTKIILLGDLQNLTTDSLFHQYDITNWRDKFVLKRAKRFDTGGINAISDFFGKHLIWLVFGVIPFSALWLKLLYRRSKKTYAEHVLYLLYLFSSFFVVLIFFFLTTQLPGYWGDILSFLILAGLVVFSYLSMKNYYQGKPLQTFFKWLLYLFGNLFLFIFITALYLVVSVFLF